MPEWWHVHWLSNARPGQVLLMSGWLAKSPIIFGRSLHHRTWRSLSRKHDEKLTQSLVCRSRHQIAIERPGQPLPSVLLHSPSDCLTLAPSDDLSHVEISRRGPKRTSLSHITKKFRWRRQATPSAPRGLSSTPRLAPPSRDPPLSVPASSRPTDGGSTAQRRRRPRSPCSSACGTAP